MPAYLWNRKKFVLFAPLPAIIDFYKIWFTFFVYCLLICYICKQTVYNMLKAIAFILCLAPFVMAFIGGLGLFIEYMKNDD